MGCSIGMNFFKSPLSETDKVLFGSKSIANCIKDISREAALALEQNQALSEE